MPRTMPMTLLVALLVLLAATAAAAASVAEAAPTKTSRRIGRPNLLVQADDSGQFKVLVNATTLWLTSGPITLQANGKVYSSADKSLRLMSESKVAESSDAVCLCVFPLHFYVHVISCVHVCVFVCLFCLLVSLCLLCLCLSISLSLYVCLSLNK